MVGKVSLILSGMDSPLRVDIDRFRRPDLIEEVSKGFRLRFDCEGFAVCRRVVSYKNPAFVIHILNTC